MTIDDAMETVTRQLDALIDQRLQTIEAQIRRDLAATGPEDDEALDRPPDLEADWQRITVEETMEQERAQLAAWRATMLPVLRRRLEAECTTTAPLAPDPA